VSDAVWAFWDFLPTAAEIAGLPIENKTDGISALPALFGQPHQAHEYLYWDYGHVRDEFLQAARWDNWKGIKNNTSGDMEIYDLATDPSEEQNLVSTRPDLVKHFQEILQKAYTPSEQYPVATK
jgi:arylsulfatase A-like enzyme